MTVLMVVELLVVLVALWIGARYGSLALGAISGIGLAILVFGFHLKPGDPPTDVIYIIIAAVTCAGILQASGGMDWMIQIAERLLRRHPNRITLLAPLTTFLPSLWERVMLSIPSCQSSATSPFRKAYVRNVPAV